MSDTLPTPERVAELRKALALLGDYKGILAVVPHEIRILLDAYDRVAVLEARNARLRAALELGISTLYAKTHETLTDVFRTALAENPAPPAADLWQPISTAPKELGTMVMVLLEYGGEPFVDIASYGQTINGRRQWVRMNRYICNPSHWMPLPAPPANLNTGATDDTR